MISLHFLKNFVLYPLFAITNLAIAATETPTTYEDLIDRVLENQSIENIGLLDRALLTPSNKFENIYPLSFRKLADPNEGEVQITGNLTGLRLSSYPPTKDLRQEAAAKLLLSGSAKADELFRQYQFRSKSLVDNLRDITNLSPALLSFFYHQAYKYNERPKIRNTEIEQRVMARFKEQSASPKVELIDATRTQVLANCEDSVSDLSISIVALTTLPREEEKTLDLVTHHFVFPQVKGWFKNNHAKARKECLDKVAELTAQLEKAKKENTGLILKCSSDFFELTTFPKFNMGRFIESCRKDFSEKWMQYSTLAESSLPLEDRKDSEHISALKEELEACKKETEAEKARIAQARADIGEKRRQRQIQADLMSHDNESWSRATTEIARDPSLFPPEMPRLYPELPLTYKKVSDISSTSANNAGVRTDDELLKEMALQKAARSYAIKIKNEAHTNYLNGSPNFIIPTNLNENEAYSYAMKYLGQLEKSTYESELRRLRAPPLEPILALESYPK